MKSMFQMSYLFSTIAGDNADDNANGDKKKNKKRTETKS